jgi:hypothetical protein
MPKIILLSFTKQSFKVFKHLIVVLEETTFDVMIVELFNDYLNLGATSPCLIFCKRQQNNFRYIVIYNCGTERLSGVVDRVTTYRLLLH